MLTARTSLSWSATNRPSLRKRKFSSRTNAGVATADFVACAVILDLRTWAVPTRSRRRKWGGVRGGSGTCCEHTLHRRGTPHRRQRCRVTSSNSLNRRCKAARRRNPRMFVPIRGDPDSATRPRCLSGSGFADPQEAAIAVLIFTSLFIRVFGLHPAGNEILLFLRHID